MHMDMMISQRPKRYPMGPLESRKLLPQPLERAPAFPVCDIWYLLHAAPWGRRGEGACDTLTLRTLEGVIGLRRYPHILSYKCHKDKFGVGVRRISCPGRGAVVNCSIRRDRVNWLKG